MAKPDRTIGRGNGLIPWDQFVGPKAYYALNENAAFVDKCGNCSSPISIYYNHLVRLHSHNIYNGINALELHTDESRVLVHKVRCRKCPQCRASLAAEWAQRGITEFNAAPRTWWGTFTISEEFLEARWAKDRNEVIRCLYENYSEEDVLAYTLTELPPLHSVERRRIEAYFVEVEITKMWKRLRFNGNRLRYCLTTEFGKRTGRLHYHALIHSTKSLRQSDIEKEWTVGHCRFRLCRTNHGAHYVAKYVAKDGGGYRTKASIGYGTAEKALLHWGVTLDLSPQLAGDRSLSIGDEGKP